MFCDLESSVNFIQRQRNVEFVVLIRSNTESKLFLVICLKELSQLRVELFRDVFEIRLGTVYVFLENTCLVLN